MERKRLSVHKIPYVEVIVLFSEVEVGMRCAHELKMRSLAIVIRQMPSSLLNTLHYKWGPSISVVVVGCQNQRLPCIFRR